MSSDANSSSHSPLGTKLEQTAQSCWTLWVFMILNIIRAVCETDLQMEQGEIVQNSCLMLYRPDFRCIMLQL